MPFEDIEILQFNQHQKSDKGPFFLHLKCLIEKIDGVKIILKIHPKQKQVNIFHQIC